VNARASSSGRWKRSPGDLASARRITFCTGAATSGLRSLGGGGGCVTCFMITLNGVSPSNGTRPAAISYNITPSE
jgi:hypothetical protein